MNLRNILLIVVASFSLIALAGCGQSDTVEDTSKMSTDKTQASEGEIAKPAASQSRGDAVTGGRGQ